MYKNILLAIDLEEESSWRKALPLAVELCGLEDARLRVLTVVPDFGMSIVGQFFPQGYEKDLSVKVMERLKDFIAAKVPKGIDVTPALAHGTVYEEILNTAEETKADLIVVSAHRPELSDYLLGPNAARVVRHANCSVMVVRN